MGRSLAVVAVVALLALPLSACGDDDEDALTGATETTQSTTGSGAGGGITTAGDFLDASVPDQAKAVKAEVAANPDCQGVDPKTGGEFQVAVAIDAASAPGDTQLSEIVGGQCSEN